MVTSDMVHWTCVAVLFCYVA